MDNGCDNETILAHTDNFLAACYTETMSRTFRRHVFALRNDAPDSPIEGIVIHATISGTNRFDVEIRALTKPGERQSEPILVTRPLIETAYESLNYAPLLQTMFDRDPSAPAHTLKNFDEGQVLQQNRPDSADTYLSGLADKGAIGPQCRLDLTRIFSAISTTAGIENAMVGPRQLKSVGSPSRSAPTSPSGPGGL